MRTARNLNSSRPAGGDKRRQFCAPRSRCSHTTATSIPKSPTSRAKPASPMAPSISTSKAKKRSSTRFSIAASKKHSTPRETRSSKSHDPREKLRRIAFLHLERLGADRDLAVVFQVELRGSTKFMEEFSAAGFAEYLALIRATFRRRTTRRRVSSGLKCEGGREDPLRRARRNGHQLDPLQAPLQTWPDGRSGAGHLLNGVKAK